MSNDQTKARSFASPEVRRIYDLLLAAGRSDQLIEYFNSGKTVGEVRRELFPNQATNGHDKTAPDQQKG